jgi:SAM-dependent methyltransferase
MGVEKVNKIWESIEKGCPPLSYGGLITPRTSRAFLSILQDRLSKNSRVLDIGCGSGEYKPLIKSLGFEYVGLDYGSLGAEVLSDAHALPIREQSVDAVIMNGAVQAFENPSVVFGEISRVLRPGGLMLSSVDCIANFILSFFNITPWGIISVVHREGFVVERMWIIKDALCYLGTNPGYPRLIRLALRFLSRLATLGVLAPRRYFDRNKQPKDFITAGSFGIAARKVDGTGNDNDVSRGPDRLSRD